MADDAGHYSPPPIVFDADEATAVAQPLLAEHERGLSVRTSIHIAVAADLLVRDLQALAHSRS